VDDRIAGEPSNDRLARICVDEHPHLAPDLRIGVLKLARSLKGQHGACTVALVGG
jgi:hypothetical protein